jgi:hypothetical protein
MREANPVDRRVAPSAYRQSETMTGDAIAMGNHAVLAATVREPQPAVPIL